MDPHIKPFEIILEKGEDIIVKTGFEATIKRTGTAPMPHYESFSVERPEDMAAFIFDDPADPRRFFSGGDDQLNCVGDTLTRNIPSWSTRIDAYVDDFAIFGSVCEPYEYMWRIIGTENSLYWMGGEPDLIKAFVDRIGKYMYALCEAQIEAARGRLSGMYIWGDVAKKLHATVWPDVLKKIKECNIHNYSIFYKEPFLFAYFEYTGEDFETDMAKMASDPMTQRWWEVCKPCQQVLESRMDGEWWVNMEEVFHTD